MKTATPYGGRYPLWWSLTLPFNFFKDLPTSLPKIWRRASRADS